MSQIGQVSKVEQSILLRINEKRHTCNPEFEARMFYAVVQLYSKTTIEKFDVEQEARDYLAACSERGVSFGLGYVDSTVNEIHLATKYKSLPEGPGKQAVKDIILGAYKVHQVALKGE